MTETNTDKFDELDRYRWWHNIAWLSLIAVLALIAGVIIGVIYAVKWIMTLI